MRVLECHPSTNMPNKKKLRKANQEPRAGSDSSDEGHQAQGASGSFYIHIIIKYRKTIIWCPL